MDGCLAVLFLRSKQNTYNGVSSSEGRSICEGGSRRRIFFLSNVTWRSRRSHPNNATAYAVMYACKAEKDSRERIRSLLLKWDDYGDLVSEAWLGGNSLFDWLR